MNGGRKFLFAAIICLPALLIVSAGVWLAAENVPRAIRTAPARIGREYRELAEELQENPSAAAGVGERRKGWRQVGKVGGCPWGYAVDGETATVWLQGADGRYRWMERPAIKPFPYALVFYGGGGVAAVALLLLSAALVAAFLAFMRERDDFLAATAHDLTTPLAGMRRMVGRDDEEARRLVERMILLVDNLKRFLRPGGARRPPELAEINLHALCMEAYSLFADDYADAAGGAVEFRLADGLDAADCTVRADAALALQIFWNLFGNDLKYAAPYGKVEVRFRRRANLLSVEFADEGPGMTKRQRRKAFDRYYRAKTVMESGKGGFGIGLCTARESARAMGGDLTVRAEGGGSVFELALPVADGTMV